MRRLVLCVDDEKDILESLDAILKSEGYETIGAKDGVRVNVLAPGAFDTPFDDQIFPSADRPDVPLGRMGRPEEAAGIVAFLLSDEASYVNGSIWRVDGGRSVLSPASAAGVAAPDEHIEF